MTTLTTTNHGIFDLEIQGDVACMVFNPPGTRYPTELIDDSFKRECRYLLKLQKFKWSPEIIEINNLDRFIKFKWYNNTCETTLCANWKEQLYTIVSDLHTEGICKPSFYTKYFYVDNQDILHAWAFYSASDYSEQPISMNFYKPILNEERARLISQIAPNGILDMRELVRIGFTDYIKWPEDCLPEIYYKVFQPH